MDREEAVRLATEFLSRRPEYEAISPASDAIFIPVSKSQGLWEDDMWFIHFPRRLPDNMVIQEPISVTVEVNATTGRISIAHAL